MLRGVLGDSVFFKGLKSYATDPRFMYGNTVTEDFQSVMENVSGKDLDYFFREWIYGEKYPVYKCNWNFSDIGNGLYKVKLAINQNQNSNPAFFTMPVKVAIKTSVTDTVVTVFNNLQKQYFEIDVKGNPLSLTVDPDNWIMKDLSLTTGIEPELELNDFALYQNYPNPFNPTTTIKFTLPNVKTSYMTSLRIYNILGKEIITLINKELAAGTYEVDFTGQNLSSGIYFYQLQSGNFISTKHMLLLK